MLEIKDFVLSEYKGNKQVVLYGYGVFREIVRRCLNENGVKEIIISGFDYDNDPLYALSVLVENRMPEDMCVILTSDIWQIKKHIDVLEKYGFNYAYSFHEILDSCKDYHCFKIYSIISFIYYIIKRIFYHICTNCRQ